MKPPEPPFLEAWRVLYIRTASSEREGIDHTIARLISGYQGEQSLAYPLSLLPPHYDVYYDLRLPYRDSFFQIDCLLVHESFLLILEVKNHRGILTFDTARHQLLREWKGETEAFQDPLLQVKRHQMQLREFLEMPTLPCEALVIVANHRARIKGDLPVSVLRPDALPFHIKTLSHKYEIPVCDKRVLQEKLLQAHSPAETDVLKRKNMSAADILPGVRCLECGRLSMQRIRTVWHCMCGAQDKRAHLRTLEDYRLLFGERITNRQARWFLQMEDAQAVKYILSKCAVRTEGPNKKKVYFLR